MSLRVLFPIYDNGSFDHVFPMGVGALAAILKRDGHKRNYVLDEPFIDYVYAVDGNDGTCASFSISKANKVTCTKYNNYTATLESEGSVDTSKVGTYEITYKATNASYTQPRKKDEGGGEFDIPTCVNDGPKKKKKKKKRLLIR